MYYEPQLSGKNKTGASPIAVIARSEVRATKQSILHNNEIASASPPTNQSYRLRNDDATIWNASYKTALLFCLLSLFAAFSCHSTQKKSSSSLPAIEKGAQVFLQSDSGQSENGQLPGNISVTLFSNSRLYIPKDPDRSKHEFILDGSAFFKIPPQTDTPFIVHTGMLNLITHHAYFHVNAHREDAGQSLELLRGTLMAEKAYSSNYPDTETLHAGDMVMINKDIDLMEKETFDTTVLRSQMIRKKVLQ